MDYNYYGVSPHILCNIIITNMCDYLGWLLGVPSWIFFKGIIGYTQYSIEYLNTTQFFYPLIREDEPKYIAYGDNQV